MSESDTMFNELSTDPTYDSQNHRWIATNNRDVPRLMKTKFPATVMVFGVVSRPWVWRQDSAPAHKSKET